MLVNNISLNQNSNFLKPVSLKSNATVKHDAPKQTNTAEQYPKKSTRLDMLKANCAEALLLIGDGIFIARADDLKNTSNVEKSNPIADKILLGIGAICVIVTVIEAILAFKEYFDNKKETSQN